MLDKTELRAKLAFSREALTAARTAYLALLNGQVQSYAIGSRNLTRFDLPKLRDEIKELEKDVAECEALLGGGNIRRAVRVIPRDW